MYYDSVSKEIRPLEIRAARDSKATVQTWTRSLARHSTDSQVMIGMIHLESGEAEASIAAFEGALTLDLESRLAQRGSVALAGQAAPREPGSPRPRGCAYSDAALSAAWMAFGAPEIFMKVPIPRSGKLWAIRNFPCRVYTPFPETRSS